MSVVYSDHSTMNSPLSNSAFSTSSHTDQYGRDLLNNYSNDFTTNMQISNYEKSLIFKFLINHSFNLLISNYQTKLLLNNFENLNQFILTLFKRLNLSLQQFQKLLVIMIRYLNKNQQIVLSLKQIVIGCLIKVLGIDSKNWCLITGLSFENLNLLRNHINLNQQELEIQEEELFDLNQQMKNLVYSKFDVI